MLHVQTVVHISNVVLLGSRTLKSAIVEQLPAKQLEQNEIRMPK